MQRGWMIEDRELSGGVRLAFKPMLLQPSFRSTSAQAVQDKRRIGQPLQTVQGGAILFCPFRVWDQSPLQRPMFVAHT